MNLSEKSEINTFTKNAAQDFDSENQPLVSVIIPVYKVEHYLRECVDSVLNQTYKNLEIILVDDGSPDSCPAICDEYAAKDSRVRVIHKENGGLSDARNAGIDIVKGEYIVFVDSDDKLVDKNCLQKLADNFSDNISVLYLNRTVTEEIDIESSITTTASFVPSDSFFRGIIDGIYAYPTAWSFICKTEFIKNNNLYFEKGLLHEDELWMPQVLLDARNQNICVFDGYFYFYRTNREGAITFQPTEKNVVAKLYIAEKLQQMKVSSKTERNLLNTRAAQLITSVLVSGKAVIKNNPHVKEKISSVKSILLKSIKPKHWLLYFCYGFLK